MKKKLIASTGNHFNQFLCALQLWDLYVWSMEDTFLRFMHNIQHMLSFSLFFFQRFDTRNKPHSHLLCNGPEAL